MEEVSPLRCSLSLMSARKERFSSGKKKDRMTLQGLETADGRYAVYCKRLQDPSTKPNLGLIEKLRWTPLRVQDEEGEAIWVLVNKMSLRKRFNLNFAAIDQETLLEKQEAYTKKLKKISFMNKEVERMRVLDSENKELPKLEKRLKAACREIGLDLGSIRTLQEVKEPDPSTLETILKDQANNILSKTKWNIPNNILSKTKWNIPKSGGFLNKQEFEKYGLTPLYKKKIGAHTFYFTKAFEFQDLSKDLLGEGAESHTIGEYGCIGFVQSGDTYSPRLFYRSGSHGVWKVASTIEDGYLGKGLEKEGKLFEFSVNLAKEMQLTLQQIQKKEILKAKKTISFQEQQVNPYRKIMQFAAEPPSEKSKNTTAAFKGAHEEEFISLFPLKKGGSQGIDSVGMPEQRAQWPNFLEAENYSIPGTLYEDMVLRFVPSYDGRFLYTFAEAKAHIRAKSGGESKTLIDCLEKESHPYLIGVEEVKGEVTSYGTRKKPVDPKGLDLPGVEYSWQVPEEVRQGKFPQDYVIEDVKEKKRIKNFLYINGDLAISWFPTWPYRREAELFKNYESFTPKKLAR